VLLYDALNTIWSDNEANLFAIKWEVRDLKKIYIRGKIRSA